MNRGMTVRGGMTISSSSRYVLVAEILRRYDVGLLSSRYLLAPRRHDVLTIENLYRFFLLL
ncbi:hypothetical protein [Wolbachia endosymbiont (group A) of Platycheirus albimanus]|nr:hypothetical protein [Wolbachia endosymbiont (group A) of Platycheirus albimanus]